MMLFLIKYIKNIKSCIKKHHYSLPFKYIYGQLYTMKYLNSTIIEIKTRGLCYLLSTSMDQ